MDMQLSLSTWPFAVGQLHSYGVDSEPPQIDPGLEAFGDVLTPGWVEFIEVYRAAWHVPRILRWTLHASSRLCPSSAPFRYRGGFTVGFQEGPSIGHLDPLLGFCLGWHELESNPGIQRGRRTFILYCVIPGYNEASRYSP